MPFHRALTSAAMLLGLMQTSPQSRDLPRLDVTKYRLENGLEVILHEDHRLPLVAVNLWYGVGAADEPPGRSGLAHLFEHLMFEGSLHIPATEQRSLILAAGGRQSASTKFDGTLYETSGPSNNLELMLWLHSDRMSFLEPALNNAAVKKQIDIVRNERRQFVDNVVSGLADDKAIQLLFPSPHPYHDNVFGSHKELQLVTVSELRTFYKSHYSPNNASVVIDGDFESTQARPLVEKYFGSLMPSAIPPSLTPVQRAPKSEGREIITAKSTLPHLTFGWVTVPSYSPSDAELDLLATLLGRKKSGLLHQKLVHEWKGAHEASCSHRTAKLGSIFLCSIVAAPGIEPSEIERRFDEVLEKIRMRGPTESDLSAAKTISKAQLLRAVEDIVERANRINIYNRYARDPGYFAEDIGRHEMCTVESVQKAASDYLDPAHRVVVTVMPERRD